MKVLLRKDCPAGKAGTILDGPEVWRFCFPTKGMVAAPLDAETEARVRQDVETLRGKAKEQLLERMAAAGSLTCPAGETIDVTTLRDAIEGKEREMFVAREDEAPHRPTDLHIFDPPETVEPTQKPAAKKKTKKDDTDPPSAA